MSDGTAIEWADATWNPLKISAHRWYCEKISPGCDNCYASTFNRRMGGEQYPKVGQGDAAGFGLVPGMLDQPVKWRKPRRVFVCSMTDLFGEWVTEYMVAGVYEAMRRAPQHQFLVLTKRAKRMRDMLAECGPAFTSCGYEWPLPNVWHGVTVESDEYAWRANYLREIPSAVRFISAEPLLSGLPSLDLTGIDWLISGGESGHGARPCEVEWVRDLRDRCNAQGTAFFHKQWGGRTPKANGRLLDGREHSEFPNVAVPA